MKSSSRSSRRVRDGDRGGRTGAEAFVVRFAEGKSRLGLGLIAYGATCAERAEQFVEYSRSLTQRLIEEKFAVRVENIKNEIRDGNFANELLADFFSSEALLERAERKRAAVPRFGPAPRRAGASLGQESPRYTTTPRFRRRELRLREVRRERAASSGNDSVISSRVRENNRLLGRRALRLRAPIQCAPGRGCRRICPRPPRSRNS